jgi:hypothetical protein
MNKKPKMGRDPLAKTTGIDSLIRDTRQDQDTRLAQPATAKPKTNEKPQAVASVKRGLKTGWIRATFIVQEVHLPKLKALAYWDRRDVKEIVDEALQSYLKGKHIKPIPEER